MDIFSLFTFLGGLALFLFGMHLLSEAIARQAGGSLKNALERITSNKLMGVLLGTGVTAVIQSSGATLVIVLGFINSGIMSLENSIGIIMGANIGTTITAWVLSLNSITGESFIIKLISPDSFVPVLAFCGAVMVLMCKKDRIKDVGMILLGFSVLMTGMSGMSDAMSPLTDSETFKSVLLAFSNPFLGVLAGFILTAVLQSSSAAVGIVQAAAVTGSITFGNSIPMILGMNIGACLVVMLAAAGGTRDAKRAAWVHLLYNIFGTFLILIPFCVIEWVFSPAWLASPVSAVQIAILHTGFKLIDTCVLLPFAKQLIKLSKLIIPTETQEQKFELLDDNFLKTPSVAVGRCSELTNDMARLALIAINKAIGLVGNYNDEGARDVRELEHELDVYEDKIGNYLVKLTGEKLSASDSSEESLILHSIGDFERISDLALNIMESGEELNRKGIHFSDTAKAEVDVMFHAVSEVVELAVTAYIGRDGEMARKVEPLEQVVNDLKLILRGRHIERLQAGVCSTTLGFVYSDILTDLERISDHCSNLAMSIIHLTRSDCEAHSYIDDITGSDSQFKQLYGEYQEKYKV